MSHYPSPSQPPYSYGSSAQYGQPQHGQPQYGQPYPAQPPVGYPQPSPYGMRPYQPLREHPEGTTILVLGIVGFVVFPCGIIAWYMANKALKEIRASRISYSNESNINVGKILGMVTSILGMVAVGLVLVQIVISVVYYLVMIASLTAI